VAASAAVVAVGVFAGATPGRASAGAPALDREPVVGASSARSQPVGASGLQAGTVGWQSVPGVIRADGSDTFRLEVDTNGPVAGVTLERMFTDFLLPPQPTPFALRDDGWAGDRVAGDFVFTSGRFRFNTAHVCPVSSNLPPGLSGDRIGGVEIHRLDGSVFRFLMDPEVGFLCSSRRVTSRVVSSDVAVSRHLINVRADPAGGPGFLRSRDTGLLLTTTHRIYEVLPDAFDILMFFSTGHVERLDGNVRNFVLATHFQVKTDFTGAGLGLSDATPAFGSRGRLLGINVLDAYGNGIHGDIATHEMLHQWGAYIDPGLGLSDGAHYSSLTSVGSLLGGYRWIDNGDGTFTNACAEGQGGARHAAPLDLYLMGLVDGSAVPPLHRDLDRPFPTCQPPDLVDRFATVTIADIQAREGVRTPGPPHAKRRFRLGFVAESTARLLDPVEVTFYETLAREYTARVPPRQPDPMIDRRWVSIDRFFQGLATFRSDVPPPRTRGT